jgi:iron complex transport system permease protein
MRNVSYGGLCGALFGLTLLLAALSILVGTAGLPGSGMSPEQSRAWYLILWEIRAPRTVLAVLTGAVLGLAGAVLQGFTRNPLADAGLLGVSSGASLGAVLVFTTGLSLQAAWMRPMAALAGAAVTTALVVALSSRRADVQTLVLAGAAIAALCSALTALALNLSPNAFAAMDIVFWLLGSVKDRSWNDVFILLPWLMVGMPWLLTQQRALQALALGEETASSLGISIRRTRLSIIAAVALTVGPVSSITGSIGFVGLAVPHILRPWVAHDPGRLLLPSTLGGAALVLAADLIARAIPSSTELQLGVVTALVGAPLFFALVFQLRKSLP